MIFLSLLKFWPPSSLHTEGHSGEMASPANVPAIPSHERRRGRTSVHPVSFLQRQACVTRGIDRLSLSRPRGP